jgi:hypothetical protein
MSDVVGDTEREHIKHGGRMKIGRNAPCPCGSGKKYKKCCGTDSASGTMAAESEPRVDRMFGSNADGDDVCMASLVRDDTDVQDLMTRHGVKASPNQWVISSGACGHVRVDGSFDTMEAALDHGRAKYGAQRWTGPTMVL